jgi:hypothetical protein
MQMHRSDDGDLPRRRANTPPPVSCEVQGLGESSALRVDFQPVQLPWLVEEIDTLRADVARARVRHEQLAAGAAGACSTAARDVADELDRRAYQLLVLDMIREQVPVSADLAAACAGSPWEQPEATRSALACVSAPVTVVGPARGMLTVLRGAARNVADALAEALRGPQPGVGERRSRVCARRAQELHRITAPVADRVLELAVTAEAFTNNYMQALRQQGYTFDPAHDPIYSDELW